MSANHRDGAPGSTRSYTAGFVLSIVLTMAAYWLTTKHLLSNRGFVAAVILLAIVQLAVQLLFFLHMGRESKPRWNLAALIFAIGTVLILVLGSLWIMYHLNYHGSQQDVNKYLRSQDGL
jgi:cytochrome o ubiquinol oxidase operon protein cyoD